MAARVARSAGMVLRVAALLLVAAPSAPARDAKPSVGGEGRNSQARSGLSLSIGPLCRDGSERDLETGLERLSESTELCGRNRIAEPLGDWSCEPTDPPEALRPCGESGSPSPTCGLARRCRGGFVHCRHAYRCRRESPDYNREALRLERQARLRAEFARLRASPRLGADPSDAASAPGEGDCMNFPERLSRCDPFECREAHPTLPALRVDRSVVGLDGDLCIFQERVTGGLSLECRMDRASRSRYADRLRKRRTEPESPREGEPPLDLAVEALALSSCQPVPGQ